MLELAGVRIDLGDRVLIDDVSFRLGAGENAALVGPNGAGKTTLLRTIGGELTPAAGVIRRPERVAWLHQDVQARPEEADRLVYDHLVAASPLFDLREKLDEAHTRIDKAGIDAAAGVPGADDELDRAVRRLAVFEEEFRSGGGYQLDAEAERIATGVGLDDEALLREVGTLSGGQRRRLELARLLLRGGDLLVLDEPTNHLDVEAKAWVVDFLRRTPATVLVVSHDIELMDASIDRVLSLDSARIDQYKGTYTSFLQQRAEREALREREASNFNKEVTRLERTIDKFRGANETVVQKRKNLEKRIEVMKRKRGPVDMVVRRRTIKVRFPEPVRAGDIVLEVNGLSKRFDEIEIFDDVSFTVGRGETFLVLGVNGAGKTTLLRSLAGRYTPDSGTVRLGANVTMGFYAQEHEDLRPGSVVIDHLRAAGRGISDPELRGILGHFGLSGDVAQQDVATLSGGEKTKLSLAKLVIGKSNLLLLDEPTNNLDPPSREAVLAALQHYKGTVMLVSHDTDFVTQLAPDRVLVLPEGLVSHFDEDMVGLVELR